MATVYAMTSIDLDRMGKKALFDAIVKSLASTFKTFGLSLDQIPAEDAIGEAKNQTIVNVCVPPYMEDERRGNLVRDINNNITEALGPQKPNKVLVYFPHHPDDCCGAYGELRSDAKAAQAAEAAREGGGK